MLDRWIESFTASDEGLLEARKRVEAARYSLEVQTLARDFLDAIRSRGVMSYAVPKRTTIVQEDMPLSEPAWQRLDRPYEPGLYGGHPRSAYYQACEFARMCLKLRREKSLED